MTVYLPLLSAPSWVMALLYAATLLPVAVAVAVWLRDLFGPRDPHRPTW